MVECTASVLRVEGYVSPKPTEQVTSVSETSALVPQPPLLLHRACCFDYIFNPLNAELNPICHLLALVGAHPIFHASRIRVNIPTHAPTIYTLKKH